MNGIFCSILLNALHSKVCEEKDREGAQGQQGKATIGGKKTHFTRVGANGTNSVLIQGIPRLLDQHPEESHTHEIDINTERKGGQSVPWEEIDDKKWEDTHLVRFSGT